MLLSICMMVKNEEKNLERCLRSLQPLRDAVDSELIIVDTGSNDKSVEIAKIYTDKVFYREWENNFSAMRNISISYCKGEWIFIIDADEELKNCHPLVKFLQSPKRKKYGAVAITTKNIVNTDDPFGYSSMVGFRLFKNDGYCHYEGAIHNQAKFKGETLAITEVYLVHYGYVSNDKDLMERKFLRTGTILKQELEKDPTNIYYWTQLSVTYAMHKDYAEATEYAEKAYSLLPEQKTPQFMFVLLNLILVYQHQNKYADVAKVCEEALKVKDGYLDVYYYYAESQAILNNRQVAINYYEKYLDIIAQRSNSEKADVSIIEYSLGCQQFAYSNLMRLYKHEEQIEKAYDYANQIADAKLITTNLMNIMELFLALGKYYELRLYYDNHNSVIRENFFENLTNILKHFSLDAKIEIANQFKEVDHVYGILCNLILDDHGNFLTSKTQELIKSIELENLPTYCSEIVYYLLKLDYPLENIFTKFKESWFVCAFEYICKRHEDLSKIIYSYLRKHCCNNTIHELKLGKVLARCALILDTLEIEQYEEVFERYLDYGINYLKMVYNPLIIEEQLIYEVKNDEDIFFIFMNQAQKVKVTNQIQYIRFLRNALNAMPLMKNGIELLFQKLKEQDMQERDEMERNKEQVKSTIKHLLELNKLEDVKTIIKEYKTIVPHDLEIVLYESLLLLKQSQKTISD